MKKLLTETMIVSPLALTLAESKQSLEKLRECVSKSKSPAYLILKEELDEAGAVVTPLRVILAATVLDEQNENGRTYRRSIMECALLNEACKTALSERQLTCTVDGHPEDVYVEPGNASHLVTRAWTEGNLLMNEWEVLGTSKGKDLRALIDSRVKFGVSIRGLGSQDSYGNILDDYEYLGTDCVGNPSARLFVTPTVTESTVGKPTFSPGANSMKLNNVGEARQYLGEQKILLAADPDSVAKARRVLAVESVINDCGLPPQDIARLLPEVDEMKSIANGVKPGVGKTPVTESAQRESVLKTENASLRNRVAELEKLVGRGGDDKKLREELAVTRAKLARLNKKAESATPVISDATVLRALKSEQAENEVLKSIIEATSGTAVATPTRKTKKRRTESKSGRPTRLYKLESITRFMEGEEEKGTAKVTWDVTNNLEPENPEDTPVATISSDDSSVIYIYAPDETEPYKLVDTENGVYVATSSVVDLVDQAVDKIDPEYLLSSDELEQHLEIDGGAEGGEEMPDEGGESGDAGGAGGEDNGEGIDDEGEGGKKESRARSGRRPTHARRPRVTESKSRRPITDGRAATASVRTGAKNESKSLIEAAQRDKELHGIPAGDFI